MRKTIYLLFILYFLIFVAGGILFYTKYMQNFASIESMPIQVETVSPEATIYYSKTDTLYRFDPKNLNNPLQFNKVEQFISTGEVGQMDIDVDQTQAVYEVKNSGGNWEIWQAKLADFQGEKIAYPGKKELEGFEDFSLPNYSPDKNNLAFLGNGGTADVIFVKDIANDTYKKLAGETGVKISDYSWSQDSKKLVFCSSSLPKNACWKVVLSNGQMTKIFDADVKTVSWNKTEDIFYLNRGETPHIFSVREDGQNPLQIDNLEIPKIIVDFQIDYQGKKITYSVNDEQKSDVYLSNIDGSNRVQMTTDGNSRQPLFSPDGAEISYLRQKDGIFLIGVNKTNEKKAVNLVDTISSLLIWR